MVKIEAAKSLTLKVLYEMALANIRDVPGTKKYGGALERCKRQYELARGLASFIRKKRGNPKRHCVMGAETRLIRVAWRHAEQLERELRNM